MFCLLTCIFILARQGTMDRRTLVEQSDVTELFQVVKLKPWEENINLTSLSCEKLRGQTQTTLDLKNQHLTSFPTCLPEHLRQLDLSGNLLPRFHSQDVADLPKLEALLLSQNQIQQVIWRMFETLQSLQSLDLSFNLLSFLPACNTSSLNNLRWLSLAGNPIAEIQPLAFSCYPQLQFLNLSGTWLGRNSKDGIKASAFAINLLPGDSTERAGSEIKELDLSATFLEELQQGWMKDLSGLTSLYLTKMSNLKKIEAGVFPYISKLRQLDCQDSHALSEVATEGFNYIPHLASLMFQNCNLSHFSPWDLSSSDSLDINLHGNPLTCHCEISWLLTRPQKIVLQRVSETMCYQGPEGKGTPSAIPLSKLYDECQGQRSTRSTLPATQGRLHHTSSSFTSATVANSNMASSEWFISSFDPEGLHMTQEDRTKEDTNEASTHAYGKKPVNNSSDSIFTVTTVVTSSSLVLEPTQAAKQTLSNTTEMDQRRNGPATIKSAVELEKTLNYSELSAPTTVTTDIGSSQFPKDFVVPHSIADSSEAATGPLQKPTKASSHPNLATTSNADFYEDYDYEKGLQRTVARVVKPCDYDPCRHLQKPCFDLQDLSPCLCPGMSSEFTIPDPPKIYGVSQTTDTSAEIHWCAPNSVVRFYQLAYHPKGSKRNFTVSGEIYATARQYTLYNLSPGITYQVCVIASNKAGSSQITDWNERNAPCRIFSTKSSYKSVFAALCAVSGVFLIVTILLSVCLCKRCRTRHLEHYNTHLVSYKNPAFDYSLK